MFRGERGHDAGDLALRCVAAEALGRCPLVGRLGGEEFAILLQGSGTAAAVDLAERLRAGMAALQVQAKTGPISLTCSFGVSEWRVGDTVDALLKRADLALYEAKHGGRNRVVRDHDVGPREAHSESPSVIRLVTRP